MVYFEKMDNSLGPNPQTKLLLDKLTSFHLHPYLLLTTNVCK